jgi:hypothetical protein
LLAAGSNGQRYGWSSDAIVMMATVGLATGTAFVWLQVRSASPLLDFSLFKMPQFTAAVIVGFVFGLGNFASNYLIPVTVQEVQGLTPFLAGLMLVPAGFLVIAGTPIFGRMADLFPAHRIVICGLCLFALGNYLMSRTDANTTFGAFAVLVIIARCGMAVLVPSLSISALKVLSAEQLHRGTGTINFIRQLGGSCGVAALVVFIERRTEFHADAMAATQTSDNTTSQALLSSVNALLAEMGLSENVRGPAAMHYLGEVIEAQASARGFNDAFLMIAAVFALAVIPAWNLGKARAAGRGDRAKRLRAADHASDGERDAAARD